MVRFLDPEIIEKVDKSFMVSIGAWVQKIDKGTSSQGSERANKPKDDLASKPAKKPIDYTGEQPGEKVSKNRATASMFISMKFMGQILENERMVFKMRMNNI